MPEKISPSLGGISQTLLLTLNARARESRRPHPLIRDELAVAMVARLNADVARLHMQRHDEIAVIMRMQRFDHQVRDFLARSPAGVVVHIGCGLDTRFQRVDNGQVRWFDLDLPEVIGLRRQLIPGADMRCRSLAASAFEEGWLEEVAHFQPGPFLFIAEGVLPYFEEEQVRALFLRLRERFPGCELVCDAHTPFVRWVDNLHLQTSQVKARLHWAVKDGRDPESWAAGIRLLDEWNYYMDADSPLKAYRWLRLIPALAKSSGVYHYRLGR